METRQVLAVLGALLLGGCASSPIDRHVTLAPAGASQVAVSTSDDGLRLTLALGVQEVRTGEAIPLTTTLEYLGPRPSINVEGATNLVSHGVHQLIGDRVQSANWNLDCSDHIMGKGEVVDIPLNKSASWSLDEPEGRFWQEYAHGPDLRLPWTGEWMIEAVAWYDTVGNCDGSRFLAATVVVHVR